MLVALDGNTVIDKMKVHKKHINKKFLDSNMDDEAIIVSSRVAEFVKKWC